MTAYKIQLVLHVAAVVVALGSTFSFPFLQAFGERQGVAATRLVLKATHQIENLLVIPGAVLVFVLGLGLIFDTNGPNRYKDDMPAWLTVSLVWYILTFATAVLVQRRQISAAIGTLEGVADGPELPAAYKPLSTRIQALGGLLGLSVIGIAALMLWKPDW